jgi:hypothetical protein
VPDHQPGAPQLDRQAESGRNPVQLRPAAPAVARGQQRRRGMLANPGLERRCAVLRLEVRRPAARATLPPFGRLVPIDGMRLAGQAMRYLKLRAGGLEAIVVPDRRDVSKGAGMHLVDRDMQMPVFGVLVHGRNPLVFREPEGTAPSELDVLHLFGRRALAFWK